VDHRDRGVLVLQQQRDRQAHDVAAPNDSGSLAGHLDTRPLEQLDAALCAAVFA
jgi:hypothetical protein